MTEISGNEYMLSCPFCGGTEVDICRTNANACWIECASCGASAASHKTRKWAIANWNNRMKGITATIVSDDDKESESRING